MRKNLFIIMAILLFGTSAFASKSVEELSRKYIGSPYGTSPAGEGVNGRYDKDPMINNRIFDCTTFVETIMFEYLSQFENGMSDRQLVQSIRYIDREPTFLNRNHFISLDWLPNNNDEGNLKEITAELFPGHYKTLSKNIDKASWFKKYHNISNAPFRISRADIDVISLDILSNNPKLIDRIPSGSVISFVTYQRPTHLKIPFEIHVLHQGLLVRKNGKAYIRHASNKRVGVIEELATQKLRKTNSFESININLITK